jgi:large subunit ribosomal protein L19
MDSIMNKVEAPFKKSDIPTFKAGDKLKIHIKVKEGANERIQIFEGDVIAIKGGGINENITIRKISNGVGVEKILPMHSPNIEKIEVVKIGRVRRAKLYYVRDRVGKSAKIKAKIDNKKSE